MELGRRKPRLYTEPCVMITKEEAYGYLSIRFRSRIIYSDCMDCSGDCRANAFFMDVV